MNDNLQNKLYEKYPTLFTRDDGTSHIHCENNDGWFPIIHVASSVITWLAPTSRYAQIKEKFGTLRLYMRDSTTAAHQISDLADLLSSRYCEQCGEPGQIMDASSWLATLCEGCVIGIQKERSKQGFPDDRNSFEPIRSDPNDFPLAPPPYMIRKNMDKMMAEGLIRERHSKIIPRTICIDFPPRLFDFVDCALLTINGVEKVAIKRISWSLDGGLNIELNKQYDDLVGVLLFAKIFSYRIDLRFGKIS